MDSLFRTIAQSDLQTLAELQDAPSDCDACSGVICLSKERQTYLFPDGKAWRYRQTEVKDSDGALYTEAVFSDVTELYNKNLELKAQIKRLKSISRELKWLSDNALILTREKEVLSAKTKLHDDMGAGLIAIRHILNNNGTQEAATAVDVFRRAVSAIKYDNAYPRGRSELDRFLQDAAAIGIKVDLSGELPRQEELRRVMILAMRECLTNSVRHAGAATIHITAENKGDSVSMKITNDGRAPETEVVPKGGLEKENIHSTESSGELMLTLMAAFAESESETMSANIKWGKRRRYEQGITGSITLNGMYGFRQNKGVVTVVEDEAELVRRIYKDFIDGYSYGEIADRLIADEVPTRMPGASWAKTTVQHIIRNEKYCGDCLFQKAFIANPITHQQVRNNGELPKYLVEDCLPAIVDKETWKLAQAVAARHTPHRQAPNERYPFTGKLFCGICGKSYYYYHYTTTNKQPLAAYRCMSRKTQSAVEVPGQTYTPPHKATFNLNASPELIAYRERYCKPPKERPMLCTDIRISIDLPQKAFCRAWNLIVAKKLRYQATLRSTVDNAEDILVRYRAEEMCLLIDEIGKINEFSYPLMLKTLDRVVVNTNGKLSFIFQSGIKITV